MSFFFLNILISRVPWPLSNPTAQSSSGLHLLSSGSQSRLLGFLHPPPCWDDLQSVHIVPPVLCLVCAHSLASLKPSRVFFIVLRIFPASLFSFMSSVLHIFSCAVFPHSPPALHTFSPLPECCSLSVTLAKLYSSFRSQLGFHFS